MAQAGTEETADTEVQAGQEQHEAEGAERAGEESGEQGNPEAQGDPGAQDEEVVVTIGGESPPPEEEDESRAPEWVRELRKSNREKDRRIRDLEAKVATAPAPAPQAVVVGEKPTLEGCNYDAAKFETELETWHARKREADDQQAQKDASAKKQQDAWNATLQEYGQEKSSLKVRDYEEAEEVVRSTLSVPQQGITLHVVDKGRRAVVVYALGKNPAKAKEFAAITDPLKFAVAVAKLEMQLKVSPKKTAPPPERTVRGSVAGAAAVDNQLEKLRADAAKTGDLTQVLKFKAQQRQGRG